MKRYSPFDIEPRWQTFWAEHGSFRTTENPDRPKFYCLDMFPYPSGAGLHVGHPEGYTATDILCRYKRAKGFNVLHPMGWDAFGLPAEQYAIQTGAHPALTTKKNCDTFRHQIQRLGLSYDWEREVNTTDPGYYRWTQWIFCRLYGTWYDAKARKGRPIAELPIPPAVQAAGPQAVRAYRDEQRLAYYGNAQVWWCRQCRIVCANEEVLADGSHEKCGAKEVERRNLKQWLMRIPHYAERLLEGLDALDWPEGIKEMQRNWIGRSTGAEVDFAIADAAGKPTDRLLRVYTTRPDTLFGATYMVVSPEHPLVGALTTPQQKRAVEAYRKAAGLKSDLDRTELAKEKSGVFSGSHAINPVNGKAIPIWVADYVLMGYGTGAIMSVPAHDTRDFDFAKKFDLPVVCIMEPDASCDSALKASVLAGEACWTEDGRYIQSESAFSGLSINGLSKKEGIAAVLDWLAKRGLGKATINYKLRDWLFSRQRYWGEPFPVIHWEDGEVSLLDEKDLPLLLPEVPDFRPGDGGESPLANAGEWLMVTDPTTGRKGRRETNTMPQWAGSCWYYLRYISPKDAKRFVDADAERYWMPVDLYVGGAEHAVLHLLYSRFWHKVLYDLGEVGTDEPFQKLFNQGMILAYAYQDPVGSLVPSDEVDERNGKYFKKGSGVELKQIVAKMSKSLKNVVNPDDVIREYGADALRLYEMFMGPLEATKPWQTQGLEGQTRFLQRAWRAVAGDEDSGAPQYSADAPPPELLRIAHQSILKVSDDIEQLRFNTAISQLMIFCNEMTKASARYRGVCEIFVQLLHPFAPHIAEELWSVLGHAGGLTGTSWPAADKGLAIEDSVEVVIQLNGKVRGRIRVPRGRDAATLELKAKTDPSVQAGLEGRTVAKVIVVPDKLVNFVVK
ncbi:MAG: leucine--tRNA ligase [Fibrobacterota bacterium]